MPLPVTDKPAVTTAVKERVDQVIVTRPAVSDPLQTAPVVEVLVTVLEDNMPRSIKRYKLSDAERTSLWNSVATLTFKNWIFNQVVPNADTEV
jgi:hypothetical protein